MGRALLLGGERVSKQLCTFTAPSLLQGFPQAPYEAFLHPVSGQVIPKVGAVSGKIDVGSLAPELESIHLFSVAFLSAHSGLFRSESLFLGSQALGSFCPEPYSHAPSHFLGPWGRKLWAAGPETKASRISLRIQGLCSHLVLASRLSWCLLFVSTFVCPDEFEPSIQRCGGRKDGD